IGLTTLPCFGAGKVSSDSFSQGFKGLCPIRYFVARRMERFTGISRGQWSSSQIFLVQSRVYVINLLFATVVLNPSHTKHGHPSCLPQTPPLPQSAFLKRFLPSVPFDVKIGNDKGEKGNVKEI